MRRIIPFHFGRLTTSIALLAFVAFLSGRGASAQFPPAQPAGPPPSPKASAPIDLTGYWVSIVNEDWRWRMITPEKGDFTSVPLTTKGQQVAKAWNPARDGACEAYGAAALMRMPTRVHVTWESDAVLKIETDAGRQVRRLMFDASSRAAGPRTLQGHSISEWERTLAAPGFLGPSGGPSPPGGTLKVVTTNLRAGWLRKNGVPYSENTIVTEYFDRFPSPDRAEWFVVTTKVEDPTYLTRPFITSSHFRREADGSKWNPTACKAS